MSQLVCIDSDVLIDYQRGSQVALEELVYLERAAPLAVSAIVRLELVIGSANKEMLQRTEKMLRRFQVLPLIEDIGAIADQLVTTYSLSSGLRLADALIAATAIYHQVPFLSKNQRDFHYLPGLQLLPYPNI